ncbi:cyclase family protein [Jannaschia pohangensis]|uniref:Kynurenine formamidase n=1 Tax=Jannaschia pohangensis TaxID=390807 RepID=A0A1I3HM69_9RHOB|nr:cyclase family protein [Jannaschia pohangensis]SFI36814.1 Kynurenine formamidase [Jannaschia pohangensis]
MCDICVMNAVKDRMLSRRDLFRGGLAAGVAGVAATVTGTAALADGHGSIRDMTHTLSENFPTFFGEPGYGAEALFNFAENGFNLLNLTINEHTGTHIDAPLHFSADGRSVDEIEIGNLIVPLCVVDIRAKAAADPDAQVTPDDLESWIRDNDDIPDRACVAMMSGWADKVNTAAYRGADDAGVLHFPGFHPEAVAFLLERTSASSIAVDTLSLDHGPSADFASHYAWLPEGRYGIENLAGLDQVPAAGATLIVGAPKHRGGTGGPARIFALI